MQSLHLVCLPFLAAHALAQVATITEYVTVPPAASTSLSASEHLKQVIAAESDIASSASAQQTTFVTSASSTSNAALSSTSSYHGIQVSSTSSPIASTAPSDPNAGSSYNGGSSGSGTAVDSDAGASGSGSSFSISKGGLIAIIVVVVVVAVFGIASTILFVVAKRRQWNIRASIARASRHLTGRSGAPPTPRTPGRSNRRTTVNAGRLASPIVDDRSAKPSGHKRGAVVEEQDVEKGPLAHKAPENTRPREGTWVQRLWGNDWK